MTNHACRQAGDKLETPVQYLKGVGPKLAKVFGRVGVKTVEDLLYFFPREYEDRRKVTPIGQLKAGETALIKGEVIDVNHEITRSRFSILKVEVGDRRSSIEAVWFNQPYLETMFRRGMKLMVSGKVEFSSYTRRLQLSVRDFEIDTGESLPIAPVYPLTEGLYSKKVRSLIKAALETHLQYLADPLPPWVKTNYDLSDLQPAIRQLHFPADFKEIEPSRRRLAFDDFFVFQLGLGLRRQEVKQEKGIAFKVDQNYLGEFLNKFPFRLTGAQVRVLEEIKSDLQSPRPMNRLLQGDVGSGKTVVAAISALIAINNGCQAAMMAPTEILTEQHYAKIAKLFKGLGVKVKLITGTTQTKKRFDDLSRWDLIIGTHALIEEKVNFRKLGLAVIDEQHRFGVLQRDLLRRKGINPHLLFMTATPIPRSLAFILYGDLDRSIIDEMPPGRVPVKTYYVPESKRKSTYEFIRKQIKDGRQVFVVCPLVEESEKVDLKAAQDEAARLQKEIFPEFKVGLIHGRLKGKNKEAIMKDFKHKKIHLLVSTTVIEVGIDIPNATVMVVEHAQRFGLSQLHQLRGRIGRGADQSHCFLLAEVKTPEAKTRIKALLDSTDGFHLAEVDLRLRGPGDFYGVRQSGLPLFRVADIIKDEAILRIAREAAFEFIRKDLSGAHNFWKRQGKKIKIA